MSWFDDVVEYILPGEDKKGIFIEVLLWRQNDLG